MEIINTANISEIKDIIQPSYDRLCRGQSDKDWLLNCSFFRNKSEKYITCEELFGKTWNQTDEDCRKTIFPALLDNFAIKFFPHLGLLAQLQQNHVNPTPLLDVSYDIYMPLFCACGEGRENMDKDGKIFVIECLDYAGVSDDLDNSEMQVLSNQNIPIFNNRMKKQAGAMIKHVRP
ncbi:MAG: FRG domain-containing protein [Eubacteriales bacterium]|nr:FRG domain-containing protein [Eubacteriales bacterium]